MMLNLRWCSSKAVSWLSAVVALWTAASISRAGSLEEGFRDVPDAARPWAYWWWLNGNVDERTISRDLEAMRQQGFGGLLLFDARGYHDDQNHVVVPPSKMPFMSPEWRRMVKCALRRAGDLGLQVSINLSSCAGALKGPWEVGNDAPKKLLWTASEVSGPQRYTGALPNGPAKRFWDVALIAVRQESVPVPRAGEWREVVTQSKDLPLAEAVVDLTPKLDAQGRFEWNVPAGRWILLRFGCAPMEGHEYDVDILDPKAVEGHFERMGEAILREAGPLAGKTLTHFYSVSWEGAAPTWTLSLEKEFMKYRGYTLRSWLPVLAGFGVRSREESTRFLRDYYRTLGDCFRDNFYGTMQRLCHHHGMKWHSESGGPWNRELAAFADADQLAFLGRNDMPQGEFWFTGYPVKRRQEMNRPPAMTAHIYGRPLAAAEAFTHMVQHWSAYPAALKPFADTAFCDGINQFIWHTFTASPPEFGEPGSEYFAGTHINPNVTWSSQAGPFITYLGRCQFMLRQGLFVGDVCVYVGDRPYVHWGRATNWSARATVSLPRGYTYDLINTEVLLDRLSAKNGDLVLPDGMRYRVLVVDLDDEQMPPAALRRISRLQKAGATVVFGGRKPQRAPGLSASPGADLEVRQLADRLWQGPATLAGVLNAKQIQPDFEGPFDYIHRRDRNTDIYFVSGSGSGNGVFRVTGRQPELWDAVSGRIAQASHWRMTTDGRTSVSLELPVNGSAFVVFRTPGSPGQIPIAPASPVARGLEGPWEVSFQPGRGAPPSAAFPDLVPWNTHPDSGIKFFSGTATYRKTFEVAEAQAGRKVRLNLGVVGCLARVRLNRVELGVVWTDPWTVDLTGALKPGRNELEIDVTNTWVNRLIGDAALPVSQRIAKSNIALQDGKRTLKAYQGFASEDPLMTSGLLGPVRLEFLP